MYIIYAEATVSLRQLYRNNNRQMKNKRIIGANLSKPHTSGTSAARVCYMYVLLLSIVRRAIIQCRLLFCIHNLTFQHANDTLTAETGEDREARLQQMRDCCYVCS